MLINQRQLKKIKVETQSGQALGLVTGFELETDTGVIEKYYVKSKNLITGLLEDKLIINRNQIISFDEEKIIVEDAAVKSKAEKTFLKKVNELESSEPVITSDLDR